MADQAGKDAKAQLKAAKQAEKARRKASTDPADMGRMRQIKRAYTLTHEYDKQLPLWVFGPWVAVLVIALVIGFVVGHPIYAGILGLTLGMLAAMIFLVRRTKKATYKRYAGQAGSAEVALSMLPKAWVSKPVIAVTRQQDAVHRTLGPGGLVLIGEGEPGRLKALLAGEVRKHERVAYGVKVTTIVMGNKEGQVPLDKLADHIKKLPKTLQANQVTDIRQRLRALDAVRPQLPMPKGPMPTSSASGQGLSSGDARQIVLTRCSLRPSDLSSLRVRSRKACLLTCRSRQIRALRSRSLARGRMANVVNAERVSVQYGTRLVLDEVSLGVSAGDVIGVVGRNGSGKTTLLRVLNGIDEPDSGRVVRTASASIGYLHQADDFAPEATVRDVIVGGEADHVWAADAWTRALVEHLLGAVDLDSPVGQLSGGERRRTALVALMLGGHDLLVLDEPTNHLDVEAVDWLAKHLRTLQDRGTAMLVVSHDRWFLDAVCSRVWEVHDGVVDAYDGGYAAYVLARAERSRQASPAGHPAQEPAAQGAGLAAPRRPGPDLEAEVPDRRGQRADRGRAAAAGPAGAGAVLRDPARQGRVRPDRRDRTASRDRTLIADLSWSIGPGDRIGLIGVNGAGKTTLLRLLTGDLAPDSGRVKRGRTIDIGHLSQAVGELPAGERVLDLVSRERRVTQVASGKEVTATSLLEDFGFTGERLTTRVGDLSGGERRRLQLLRLLIGEPNVLLLDEPTNDLDIDTLTVVEDYLDSWPGTLIVVSHDRYFLERVCDVTYALLGDGQLRAAARRGRPVPGHPARRRARRLPDRRAPPDRGRRRRTVDRRPLPGRDPPGPQGPGPDREPAGQAGPPGREAARADGRDGQRLRQAGRAPAAADGGHRRAGRAGRRLADLRRDPRLTARPHARVLCRYPRSD